MANKKNPGDAYIQKVMDFIHDHYKVGELFMKFVKHGCVESTGVVCEFCRDNPLIGPAVTRAPQSVLDPGNNMPL